MSRPDDNDFGLIEGLFVDTQHGLVYTQHEFMTQNIGINIDFNERLEGSRIISKGTATFFKVNC